MPENNTMRYLIYITLILALSVTFAQENKSQLDISYNNKYGYYMNVYDFSPSMMKIMKKRKLHGGGPTWVVLLETALKTESPVTLGFVELDDESTAVQVRSKYKDRIKEVQIIAKRLMSDKEYLLKYINLANKTGHLE